MEKNLKDKVVVVTGGAMGIGYAISDKFLERGANVVIILDINERGKIAAKDLNLKYGENKAVYYKCDVTEDLEVTWKQIIHTYKYVDVLVNNAGIANEKVIKRIFDINALALINWSLKAWEHMRIDKGGKGGTIINTASIFGYRSDPFCPIYKATKYAVMGFTKSLGHTYNFNRSGVRVVAICPGYTKTETADTIIIWDRDVLEAEFNQFVNSSLPEQNADAVGKAAVEVFETASSGTAWEIEGAGPIVPVNDFVITLFKYF